MLKLIASAIFIGSTILGFSVEDDAVPEKPSAHQLLSMISKIPQEELPALLEYMKSSENFYAYSYLGFALINMESGDYSLAIESLNRAEESYFASPETQPALEFLIAFAKAVAYDNLDMSKESAHALGSLVLIAVEEDDEEVTPSKEPNVLQALASQAKSPNLRKFLSFVADDSDE